MVMGELYIGPRTATITPEEEIVGVTLQYTELGLKIPTKLYIGTRPATITPEEEIVGVTVQYMEVGLNISTTLRCSMLEKVLMELGEVDLGLRQALLNPII